MIITIELIILALHVSNVSNISFILNTATPCASAPCYNGGSCRNVDQSTFECACAVGFVGDRFQLEGNMHIFFFS